MFPSSNTFPTASTGTGQDQRQQFPHSHSHPHPVQYNGSPFNVAGMSSLNQSGASPSIRGGSLGMSMGSSLGMGSPLSESLSQSRSHYQSGYLMSVNQSSSSPPGPREEPPLVPTKAKLNHTFSGGAVSDFGMDSMFESSRQRPRQTLADEDAPPTASVNDIVNEIPDSRFSQRNAFDPSQSRLFRPSQASHPVTPKPTVAAPQQNAQPLYVVVFGYPPDKYSVAVQYFRSLGETTEAEQSTEVVNCFRIGYLHHPEAIRAVRKNGEILGGSWMVGAKWADVAQAEALLGASLVQSTIQSPEFLDSGAGTEGPSPSPNVFGPPSTTRMSVDEVIPRHGTPRTTEPFGTPIKLAPSASAFRRPGGGAPVTPVAAIQPTPLHPASGAHQQSPTKGMLGQVSDLIFGW